MHDPVGAHPLRRAAAVVDERLLHADGAAAVVEHAAVLARGLPVPGPRRAVRAEPVGVLAVPRPEEVPLGVAARQERLVCTPAIDRRRSDACMMITLQQQQLADRMKKRRTYLRAPMARTCRGRPPG